MSLVRDDDPQWWAALAIITVLVALGIALLHGEPHRVILHGTIFEADPGQEACRYILDPAGESETISLVGNEQSYLCEFLKGSQRVPFTVTLGPD